MTTDDQARLLARVEGRVQGVGFRYFVLEYASKLGVTGWVRNRWDGSVEVLAEGQRDILLRLLGAIQRGPRANTTTKVIEDWGDPSEEFKKFRIRRTE
jgi:acylphosphatase